FSLSLFFTLSRTLPSSTLFPYTTLFRSQQTTCSILTPANKAALKALAIAEGGTTVVPKVFSGEFSHFCGQKCKKWFVPRGEIKRSLLRSFHKPDIRNT